MKLVFTLGNPEHRYKTTRHNIGFQVADTIASEFKLHAKFFAEITELNLHGEKVIVAKPTTYYNEVGRSLIALKQFYKLEDADILIVHDELALPFGTIRTRIGGSDAGNNGIKSINTNGGAQTMRLRIGIRSEIQSRIQDTDFVLGNFSKDEQLAIKAVIVPKVMELIDQFVADNHQPTSHLLI